MVLRMPRPQSRAGTANRQYRRRYPADIKPILERLGPSYRRPAGWGRDEITLSLGTADPAKAKTAHARISAEIETRFAMLKAGPQKLSHKDAVALSGEVYRALMREHEENPGAAERKTPRAAFATRGTPFSGLINAQ
jgi:hypothetical protein